MKVLYYVAITVAILFFSCSGESPDKMQSPGNAAAIPQGKLFIIGGGNRPAEMINELIDLAGLREGGYGVILPMSSEEPDSSIYYAMLQFEQAGLNNVTGMDFNDTADFTGARVDSVKNASLIYISGGDQNRFMEKISGTGLQETILEAYRQGAVIAGTSAGAAVMSEQMITGNELKHPDYNATFRHIQADNIEIASGLGLLDGVIIDQHFVKRSRYNRLLSAVMEYPGVLGIGIDESTAVVVDGDSATVTGESQVILFRNLSEAVEQQDLLGSENIQLQVLLPGDKFRLN